jgi:hypothetical protein
VAFLLLHEEFPRSVRFCAEELDAALRRISGVPAGRFANAAEQRSGRMLATAPGFGDTVVRLWDPDTLQERGHVSERVDQGLEGQPGLLRLQLLILFRRDSLQNFQRLEGEGPRDREQRDG